MFIPWFVPNTAIGQYGKDTQGNDK